VMTAAAVRVAVKEISRGWNGLPGAASFPGGGRGEGGVGAMPRVISTAGAQAASSCWTRSGVFERSIGPVTARYR
jgi:hypothetical protein